MADTSCVASMAMDWMLRHIESISEFELEQGLVGSFRFTFPTFYEVEDLRGCSINVEYRGLTVTRVVNWDSWKMSGRRGEVLPPSLAELLHDELKQYEVTVLDRLVEDQSAFDAVIKKHGIGGIRERHAAKRAFLEENHHIIHDKSRTVPVEYTFSINPDMVMRLTGKHVTLVELRQKIRHAIDSITKPQDGAVQRALIKELFGTIVGED
ncbi:MAG: hypothetical protein O3A46_00890 [Candidatus Poribacteria bacterium]|nr:hypothetical protein [Candidatus Poribacteria bacterium]